MDSKRTLDEPPMNPSERANAGIDNVRWRSRRNPTEQAKIGLSWKQIGELTAESCNHVFLPDPAGDSLPSRKTVLFPPARSTRAFLPAVAASASDRPGKFAPSHHCYLESATSVATSENVVGPFFARLGCTV
jgi:hypothetical protein